MNEPVASVDQVGAWAKLEPNTYGFYVNEYNTEDAARLRTTYGDNFGRMVDLKTKYDPDNLFRLNANVAPQDDSRQVITRSSHPRLNGRLGAHFMRAVKQFTARTSRHR